MGLSVRRNLEADAKPEWLLDLGQRSHQEMPLPVGTFREDWTYFGPAFQEAFAMHDAEGKKRDPPVAPSRKRRFIAVEL